MSPTATPPGSVLPLPAELLLSAIVESCDDAIVSKNLEGVVTSWNRAAERMFGYTAAEMIGTHISRIFPSDRLDEEPRILDRLRRGERVDHYRTIRVRKNGEHFPVSLTISPIIDRTGVVVGASKVARDITREVQALDRLTLANEELVRADRMKSEFVAMMSHELRTPLNSIIGFAGVLRSGRSGPLTEDQRQQLALIQTSGKHLLNLINDLLDMSRMEAGKLELDIAAVALAEVVDETARTLRPQAEQKHLRIDVMLEHSPVIQTDRKRVMQIVLNLLNNAVKFTSHGRISITLSAEADGGARIEVADTGIGIAAEQRGSLFRPFTQLEHSSRRRYEGAGLGLYLSKRFATMLGGDITLESVPQRGSTFTLRLPAAAAHTPEPVRKPPVPGSSPLLA